MKYINVEKLKDEIESISLIPQTSADYNDGRDDMKMMFLDIIDSLQQEQSKVDLEKEWKEYFKYRGDVATVNLKHLARHFFDLGLKANL